MKPSLTFVPGRLGLAAAAPRSNPDPSKYALSKDFPDRIKKTMQDLKAQNQDVGKAIGDVAQQVGWQVTGKQAKDVLKKFASASIELVPTFGALGGLPGFLAIMKAITMGIFNFEPPELAAKADMKGKRFSDEAAYEDLCNNCQSQRHEAGVL
ncbi:hypothetical protein MANI_005223 [Metarhizium anisopliae]